MKTGRDLLLLLFVASLLVPIAEAAAEPSEPAEPIDPPEEVRQLKIPENTWVSHFYLWAYGDEGFDLLDELCMYNRLLLEGFDDCDVVGVEQQLYIPPWEVLVALAAGSQGERPEGSLVERLPEMLQATGDHLATAVAAELAEPRGGRHDRWAVGMIRLFRGAGLTDEEIVLVGISAELDIKLLMERCLTPVPERRIYYDADAAVFFVEVL